MSRELLNFLKSIPFKHLHPQERLDKGIHQLDRFGPHVTRNPNYPPSISRAVDAGRWSFLFDFEHDTLTDNEFCYGTPEAEAWAAARWDEAQRFREVEGKL